MMKKVIKKLLAALLAVAMLCAMAVPALATDDASATTAAAGTGSITIDNVVTGHTYKLYRILELEYHAATSAYRYTTNQKWEDFVVNGDGASYLTKDNNTGAVTWSKNKSSEDNGTDIQAFANAAGRYAKTHNIAADYTDKAESDTNNKDTVDKSTKLTFSNLPLGWYLVVSDLNDGAICSIDTTDPTVVIKEKNGDSIIHKQVVEGTNYGYSNDASIGDKVTFQIDVSVFDGQPNNYVVHDGMSDGLSFNDDVKVYLLREGSTLLTLTANTDYTVVKKPTGCNNLGTGSVCSFEVRFTNGVLKANDQISIIYTATVNDKAVIGSAGNPNETILEYNNKHTEKSTTKTYVWEMGVHKFANLGEKDKDYALENAEFQLYKDVVKGNTTTTMYAIFSDATTSTDGTSVYKLTGWTDNAANAITVVTPASGNIKFEGLDAGTYYLKETKAPTGYNTLPDPITVVIDRGTLPTVEGGTVSYTVKYGETTASDGVVRVENKTGTTLPGTGGIGTTLFYVVGGGLMVAAIVLLVTKKRMENK